MMPSRTAWLTLAVLGVLASAAPARAEMITIDPSDCAKPNLVDIHAARQRDIPRALLEKVIKQACDKAKAAGAMNAPRPEPKIDWPVANCAPAHEIGPKLKAYTLPSVVDEAATFDRIIEACRGVRLADGPDPAASHVGSLHDAQFLPDGSFVSVGQDLTMRVWSTAAPTTPPRLVYTGDNQFWRVQPSPDGRFAAVSSFSGPIKVIDLKAGKVAATLETVGDDVRVMTWLPDGSAILAAASEKEVGLFDATSGKLLHKYPAFDSMIEGIAVHPNGDIAAAVTRGSEIRVWLIKTGVKAMIGRLPAAGATALAFEPGGNRLIVGMIDRFEIYDMKAGKFGKPLTLALPRRWRGIGAAFLPERDRAVTCGATLNVWDLSTSQDLGERARFPYQCYSLALSSDGATALVTHEDSDIRLFDVKTGTIKATFGKPKLPDLKISLPMKQ